MAKKSQPKLFFLAGRLKWRGIPKDWEKPEKEDEYEALIKASAFIVDSDLQEYNLANSQTVKQDIQDLKTNLLERHFRSDKKAKHFQNDYFRQQWVLVLGTFITALVATITIILSPPTNIDSSDPVAIEATAEPNALAVVLTAQDIAQGAGIVTAIVTFVTTIVTYLIQAHRPQYNWYLWRTVAEELRRHYFLFLAHLPPYHTTECADVLELNVAQIETQQQKEEQPATTEEAPPRTQHSEGDIESLIKLYRAKRVQVQNAFYEARIEEDKKNANFVSFTGVSLVALATLLSAINAVFGLQAVVLLIALLPVMAALLVLFEKIYGWGRQIALNEGTFKRLAIDNTIPPAEGHKPSRPYADVFLDFVSSVENTLKSEMSQWGQNVLKDGSNVTSLSAQETLDLALAKSNLNKEQIENIHKIFSGQ